MLEEVLHHIHNWFVVPGGVHTGTFTVKGGGITLPFLMPGQYFRIIGSVFSDGVYRHPVEGLPDETFVGEIWAMAVPPSVIALSSEIEQWVKDNPDTAYVSESFAGYSRTLGTNANTGVPLNWQAVFRSRLNVWRKLS